MAGEVRTKSGRVMGDPEWKEAFAERAKTAAPASGKAKIDTSETEVGGPGMARMEDAEDAAIEKALASRNPAKMEATKSAMEADVLMDKGRIAELDAARAKALGEGLDAVEDQAEGAMDMLKAVAQGKSIMPLAGYAVEDVEGAGYKYGVQPDGSIKILAGPKAVGKVLTSGPAFDAITKRIIELATRDTAQ